MTQARYENLKRVFHGAVDLPPDQRAEFVARECGSDATLRAEVENLLREHDAAEGFLDHPVRVTAVPDGPLEAPGAESLRFASYSVLRTLGRGGMGVVYLAQQDGTERTVALKVIRAGLATPGALKRFAFEAQVLGRLNHAGIAQIYEAGTADTGQGPQPYFAMELVDGVPITDHARSKDLPLPQRLALLAQVCDAVEYAHVKGVIHRDLKPGNILVDKAGQVKVLDFGVARATTPAPDSGATHQPSQLTEPGQLVGTLPYMSPEQIAGDPDDLDTRSDVYALGVIGYELLADKPAFAVDRLPPLEAARLVKETEPAPLSSFSKVYRGDIETVIAKAMDKDRARRYQSAAALAADIRRYLNDEPVEARPASAWYQARKFARRNKALVTGFVATLLVLTGATVSISILAHRERAARLDSQNAAATAATALESAERSAREVLKQESEAARQAGIARTVLSFMLEDWAESIDPQKGGPDVLVRDMLDGVAARISGAMAGEPEAAATLHLTVGRMYAQLALFPKAEEHIRESVSLRKLFEASNSAPLSEAENYLGQILMEQHRFSEAREVHERVLSRRREELGELNPDTLVSRKNLAEVALSEGHVDDAVIELRAIAELAPSVFGDNSRRTWKALAALGDALAEQGHTRDALQILRRALDGQRSLYGPDHPDALATLNSCAVAVHELGDLQNAEGLYRDLLERCRRVYTAESLQTLRAMLGLGTVLADCRKFDEAAQVLTSACDEFKRRFGPSGDEVLTTLGWLAQVRRELGQLETAETLERTRLAGCTAKYGESHPQTLYAANGLVGILIVAKRPDEALGLAESTLSRVNEGPGIESPVGQAVLQNLVLAGLDSGRFEQVREYATRLVKLRDREGGPGDLGAVEARLLFMAILGRVGRADKADLIAQETLTALRRDHPDDAMSIGRVLLGCGTAFLRSGDFVRSEPMLLGALEQAERSNQTGDLKERCTQTLVELYERSGRGESAEKYRSMLAR